jgi:hypothetical protein
MLIHKTMKLVNKKQEERWKSTGLVQQPISDIWQ